MINFVCCYLQIKLFLLLFLKDFLVIPQKREAVSRDYDFICFLIFLINFPEILDFPSSNFTNIFPLQEMIVWIRMPLLFAFCTN